MNNAYTKLDLEQGTPEWLNARYDYVTASQTPILFDLSPHQTRLGLFEEKTQRREMQDKTGKEVLFQRGHNAERAAREYLKSNLGLEFQPAVLVSKAYPCLLASLDGHIENNGLIFEAKFVGSKVLAEVRARNVPPHHLCQMQASLLVSQAKKCLYFVTDPNGDSHMVEILPDANYQELIAETAKAFWECVASGEPPEPSERDFIHLSPDDRIERLVREDAKMKESKKIVEALKKEILSEISMHKRVSFGAVTFTLGAKSRTLDKEKMIADGIDVEKYKGPAGQQWTMRVGKTAPLRGVG